ncbi:tRNA pseudouridine(55) synthase TruB [Alkalibacillus sp. S2W]|uniref:tRNA pseudouridine(55) synthase TruB n=1 Tax=Alkalibacillus sp. S2W TaxID=3386553 RepID=UPI00398D3D93
MMNGIIPLWKPKGMTSHDCVNKLRGILQTKKIGHTGTLDPNVEGVLPMTVGKATKLTSFITDHTKTYVAEVSLGQQTTTEDNTGDTVSSKIVDPTLTLEDCKHAIEKFKGEIRQIPPMYSAVKVNGMKLYEYAREGLEVERPVRDVTIHSIELATDQFEQYSNNDVRFSFRINCSSGTYVRTLCVDIGAEIGYPAHMTHLIREEAGTFHRDETVTFAELEEAKGTAALESYIQDSGRALTEIPVYVVEDDEIIRFKHGQVLPIPDKLKENDLFRVETEYGELIALYQPHPTKSDLMKPYKVLQT